MIGKLILVFIFKQGKALLFCTRLNGSKYYSSSSCCTTGTDIPDSLSPLLPIAHRLW